MVRTIKISGDQIQVHTDIGPGRIISATLVVDDAQPAQAPVAPIPYEADPFGKELDDLLAQTDPIENFVDDSREAIYTPDDQLPRKSQP